MKCFICKQVQTQSGTTTVTLERGDMTLVYKHDPAQICTNYGEAYVDEQVSAQILKTVGDAARTDVQVDIREFIAASM